MKGAPLRRVVRAAVAAALATAVAAAAPAYETADGAWRFAFPRDHASHPAFRTEWWYYTGHLTGGGRAWGYELTFFRVGIDAARAASGSAWAPHTVHVVHAALTDETGRRFRFEERAARPALGIAGADTAHYRVWVEGDSAWLDADDRTHRLRAARAGFALDLALAPTKPPAVHGAGGVSRKAAGAGFTSHYYSLTRLATSGVVTVDGRAHPVSGVSWMDHEFGSGSLAPTQSGWDWFSFQLDDGRELMLYRLRLRDGTTEPFSSGTLIEADGRATHLPLAAFTIAPRATWRSVASGATYPARWRVRVPQAALELDVTPTMADQELRTPVTGVTYWEGSVRVSGRAAGRPVTGVGYVELTGYVGPVPGP